MLAVYGYAFEWTALAHDGKRSFDPTFRFFA